MKTTEPHNELTHRKDAVSTKVRTPQDHARSSTNATFKHGISSSKTVLANESQQDFDNLYLEYCNEFQPAGRAAYDLIQNVAAAFWNIVRTENTAASAIGTAMFIHKTPWTHAPPCIRPIPNSTNCTSVPSPGSHRSCIAGSQ